MKIVWQLRKDANQFAKIPGRPLSIKSLRCAQRRKNNHLRNAGPFMVFLKAAPGMSRIASPPLISGGWSERDVFSWRRRPPPPFLVFAVAGVEAEGEKGTRERSKMCVKVTLIRQCIDTTMGIADSISAFPVLSVVNIVRFSNSECASAEIDR